MLLLLLLFFIRFCLLFIWTLSFSLEKKTQFDKNIFSVFTDYRKKFL